MASGYLEKYSGGKQQTGSSLRRISIGIGNSLAKWERRYFVLADGTSMLSFHKVAEDAQPGGKPARGTMPCKGSIVSLDPNDPTAFSLSATGEQPTVMWLRAESLQAAEKWIGAIVAAGATKSSCAEQQANALNGVLLKQDMTRSRDAPPRYDKRHFRLVDGTMSYFKSEAEMNPGSKKPPLGSFVVSPAVTVNLLPPATADEPQCTFAISNGDACTYTLKVSAFGCLPLPPSRPPARLSHPSPPRCSLRCCEASLRSSARPLAALSLFRLTPLLFTSPCRFAPVCRVGALQAASEAEARQWVAALVRHGAWEKRDSGSASDEQPAALAAGVAAAGAQPASASLYPPIDVTDTADASEQPASATANVAAVSGKKRTEKRAAVSAEASSSSAEAASPYVRVVYPKTEEARAFINSVVADSALFSGASAQQRAELVNAMQERTCAEGECIIRQGDDGHHFFVVRSGEYGVYLKQVGDDAPVHKYKPGGSFGELALLYNKPRAATIKCTCGGLLYQLDRATFRGVLIAGQRSAADASLGLLRKVPLLEGLTEQQYNQLLSILSEEKHVDGETVCPRGAPMDSLYMVKEGLVKLIEGPGSQHVVPYQPGDFFGASALSDDAAHSWPGAMTAVGDQVTLLRLRRSDMLEVLGDLSTLLRDNFRQRVLGSIEMFRMLSAAQLSLLVDSFTEQRYTAGDTVIRQGDEGDTFYIIKSGQVRVSVNISMLLGKAAEGAESAGGSGGADGAGAGAAAGAAEQREIAKLNAGDYFGEMALLDQKPRMATVTAVEATICMTVDRQTFSQVLGPLRELMDREAERRKAEVEALSRTSVIRLADLKDVGTLGIGTFGRVKLVEHKPTGVRYALKCMRKRQLIEMKQVEHVINEKQLLGLANHPFVISLAASYQDGVELYMLLELSLGGELFTRLRDYHRFEESTARFYAASVVSAFAHLHDLSIAYRDLKPENLLLDTKGYMKLCDFGFAKMVTDGRTFTLCGTPEYLAPEIISNVGHSMAVDWWGVGILVFEMLTGDAPFMADDPMVLYQLILRGSFVYPQLVGKAAKDLISKLLVTNPAMRLGIVKKGHRDLMGHPFFKPIDFAQLVRRTGKPTPPFVPTISHEDDMSYFDEVEEGASLALNPKWDQPCTPEENALFTGFSL